MRILLIILSLAASLNVAADAAFKIEIPEKVSPVESTAVEELRHYLPKLIKNKFNIAGKDNIVIHLGIVPELQGEEWRIHSQDNNLYLQGGSPRGVLYAVYHFLEDQLGVHWLTQSVDYVPEPRDIELPALDIKGKPAFPYRSIYRCFGGSLPLDKGRFTTRNRCLDRHNPDSNAYGGFESFGSPSFTHALGKYITPEDYLKSHPDFFALVNGKRTGGATKQFCFSNPAAMRDIVLTKLRANIAKDKEISAKKGIPAPTFYDLSLNDGSYICECAACKGRNPAELLLEFLNPLAREIAKTNPEVQLTTLAYLNLETAPSVIKPDPHLWILLCDTKSNQAASINSKDNRLYLNTVKDWSKISKRLGIWDYGITYTVTGFPYASEFLLADTMRTYAENGVKFMFWELDIPEIADMYHLKSWMTMKLMENPYADDKALFNTFMDGYYGKAAPALKKYRFLIKESTEKNHSFIDWYARPKAFKHLNLQTVLKAQELFDDAEKLAAKDSVLLGRVQRARLGLDRATCILFPDLMAEWKRTGKKQSDFPLNRDQILKRTGKTWSFAVQELSPRWGKNKTQMLANVKAEIAKYAATPVNQQVPSKFAKTPEYYDYTTEIAYNYHNIAKKIADPESETGRVLVLDWNVFPLEYGAYTKATKVTEAKEMIRKVKGPGYHWYKLMNLRPGGSTYVYLTGKWYIQFPVGNPIPQDDKTFEVWVRLKFTGPAYHQPGNKNQIFFERLVMVPLK